MAWIQVDDSIREHDKIYNLADVLGIPDAHAIGLMVCLWTWAATSAPDGDLTSFPPRAIAGAAKWDKGGAKGAQKFYDTLIKVKFLEQHNDKVFIRNWDQRASLLIDYVDRQRENTRKRVAKCRENKRKKSVTQDGESPENVTPCNVTVTRCNAPNNNTTQHNLNITNTTTNLNTTTPTVEEAPTDVLCGVIAEFTDKIRSPKPGDEEALRQLCELYTPRAVSAAIANAAGKGRSVNYLKPILANWQQNGLPPRPAAQEPEREPSYNIDEYEKSSIFDDLPPGGEKAG